MYNPFYSALIDGTSSPESVVPTDTREVAECRKCHREIIKNKYTKKWESDTDLPEICDNTNFQTHHHIPVPPS